MLTDDISVSSVPMCNVSHTSYMIYSHLELYADLCESTFDVFICITLRKTNQLTEPTIS